MNDPLFETIREILLQYIEVDEACVTEEARLQEDLFLNSLDYIYILMDLEEKLDIQFSDEDVGSMRTVKDIEAGMKRAMDAAG